jgi:hypothetical protein
LRIIDREQRADSQLTVFLEIPFCVVSWNGGYPLTITKRITPRDHRSISLP